MHDMIARFKVAMQSKGFNPPNSIIPDGQIHRFSTEDNDPHDQAGWYVFHGDNIPAGSFGNWRTGEVYKWCSSTREQMSEAHWEIHKRRMAQSRQLHDLEKAKSHKLAAELASMKWDLASLVDPNHPYLSRKQVFPFLARQKGNDIILPIVDFEARISSLQFIQPDGTKRLLMDGAKKGRYIPIRNNGVNSTLLICEGFSTGATLAQEHPGHSVFAAVDAGNLKAVAVQARKMWPSREIVICADDDRLTIGNPGMTLGRSAASAAQAIFRSPAWPVGAPEKLSDFNDLACWRAARLEEEA